MKALSKKRRGGRPAKNGPRHPSGQLVQSYQQSETEKEVKSVVIEARERIHGNGNASDLNGYVLGRIYLDGNLSKLQNMAARKAEANAMLDAGNRYARDIFLYHQCYLGHAPTVAAQNLMKVRGYDGDVTESESERGLEAKKAREKLETLLLQCGVNVRPTVYNVCVNDFDSMRNLGELQLNMLRRGLKALVKHYGIQER